MLRNLNKISLLPKSKFSSAAPAPKPNPEILYTGVSNGYYFLQTYK